MQDPSSHTLVVTATSGSANLDGPAVEALRRAVAQFSPQQERWLSPGEAWQVALAVTTDTPPSLVRDRAATAIAGRAVDVNLIAGDAALRRKKLLIADMDSTMIGQECIDEMADVFGLKSKVAAITERAMRGELPFENALQERLALLAGLSMDDLALVYDRRITLMPGARTLVQTMKANGAFAALVSGGFTFFTSRVAAAIGFDADHANVLAFDGDRLTGDIAGPILGRAAKRQMLETYSRERGLGRALTLAVGDGANDLAMIEAAGLGVAYRAKPVVAAAAGASISHGDLTALLYLQGYHRDEFVAVA